MTEKTMVGILDIAKQCGVSASTVSRVANGFWSVNSRTRAQVLKIIEQTGYVPNRAARDMVLRRSFTVGIIISSSFNLFQRHLLPVVEAHLKFFGYNAQIFFVHPDDAGIEHLNSVCP
jgi:LacI family transcriptional regulator